MPPSIGPRFGAPGTPSRGRFIVRDPVRIVDGVCHLRLGTVDVPIHHGAPVRSFLPGWRATALYTAFAPVYLLEFRSDAGGTGVWFLDHRLHHLCDDASRLPAELRDLLRARAAPLVREIVDSVLGAAPRDLSEPARDLLELGVNTRVGIGLFVLDQVIPRPVTLLPEQLGEQGIAGPCASGNVPVSLPARHLRAGFEPEWQDRIQDGLRTGTLRWPSPVDGQPLDCEGSLVFDDFHFAFKFADRRHDLSFLVTVGDHRSAVGGVWFPFLGVLIGESRPQGGAMRTVTQHHAPHWVMSHVLERHGALVSYLAGPKTGFSNILRTGSRHIGHQLWNELTGIDALVQAGLGAAISHVAAGPAGSVEIYGPLDRIFPSLAGRVDRAPEDWRAIIDRVYRTGSVACRVTGDHVSAVLRERIGRHARNEAERIPGTSALLAGNSVVLGLRVENRTLVGMDAFYRELVALIDRRFPWATVIFDGHNASDAAGGPAPIGSHGENLAAEAPHDVERRLVEAVRAAFPHRRDRILDTIMRPVPVSLAAAASSRCFVSVWGASLAKYRWIANKPGFVLASAWNLRHRGDLDIYHSPRYMDDPAPIEFVDPELVRDDAEAEQVVPVSRGHPGFANFHVDAARTFRAIEAFLERHLVPG